MPEGAPTSALGARSGAPSGLRPSSFVMCNTPVEVQFITSAGCLNYPYRTPEGSAMLFDLFRRFRVDHFVVVLGNLVMQALRGVGKEITMLMHGASLHRHAIPNGGDRALEPRAAIDDEELGPLQAPPDEIVEDRAPGLGALAAHLFDRQEHFLTVLANPDDNEQ